MLDTIDPTLNDLDDPTEFVLATTARMKRWLADAEGDVGQIADIRGQAESLRIYGLSRKLSTDAQLDATEVVRRAEYALAKTLLRDSPDGKLPLEFFSLGRQQKDSMILVQASPAEFEAILAEGRTEGNLSRNSLITKIRPQVSKSSRRARRPYVESAREAVYKALRAAETVGRLTADDRRTNYAAKIDPLTRNNLRRAINVLTTFADSIDVDHLEEK